MVHEPAGPPIRAKRLYDEVGNYDWDSEKENENNFEKIGHFTQLVWAETHQMGFGHAVVGEDATVGYLVFKPTIITNQAIFACKPPDSMNFSFD